MADDHDAEPTFDVVFDEDERRTPCECCDEGVSYTTGDVCIACDGFGWREP
jgi:hypothetical protein